MVQTMKLLIVEPSPLIISIPLGSKYSPQDENIKYESQHDCDDIPLINDIKYVWIIRLILHSQTSFDVALLASRAQF